MAEYNRSSLINIATQDYEVLSGEVSRQGQNMILGQNSSCRFTMEYLFSKDNLKTSSLLVRPSLNNSVTSVVSRYNPKVKINLHIQYYKEDNSGVLTSYVPGTYSTRQIYPYFNNESDGRISEVVVNISNTLICKLYVDLVNDGENTVTFNGLSIYKEQTATDIVQDALGGLDFDKRLKSIDSYEDELVAYYIDRDNPVTLRVSEGEASNIYKINVSDVYELYIAIHNGAGPYRGSDE